MNVQVFGIKNDDATRKALRFFSERRIATHFVDFKVRGPSKGELRRFVQRFGIDAVLDRDSKRFASHGLARAAYGPDRWLDILTEDPLLLRMPLVRSGNLLSVGEDRDAWASFVR